jgi:hypothetical protein
MRRLAALCVFALVLVVLGVGQLVLPGIAAQRLRDRLQRSGQVLSVHVSAFPAIQLLFNRADSVSIRLGRYRSGPGQLSSLLAQAGDVDSLTASATRLDTGLLTLRHATLEKHGSELVGTARVTESDLRKALPVLRSVTPVASSGGRLTVRGTATLFGVTASVDATVGAHNGALVVTPDFPFGGLATITVFSNPHVEVQSIGAARTSTGFAVRATARLK